MGVRVDKPGVDRLSAQVRDYRRRIPPQDVRVGPRCQYPPILYGHGFRGAESAIDRIYPGVVKVGATYAAGVKVF